jgi:hypothetical protein
MVIIHLVQKIKLESLSKTRSNIQKQLKLAETNKDFAKMEELLVMLNTLNRSN